MLKSLKDFLADNNCYCGSLPLIKLHDFPSLISQDSGCLFMFSFGILRGKLARDLRMLDVLLLCLIMLYYLTWEPT